MAVGWVAGRLAAVMSSWETGGTDPTDPPHSVLRSGLRLDRLVEGQLAVLDLVDAVVGERDVAVLVHRVRPKDALAVLRGEERLQHLGTITRAGPLDRVEDQPRGLVAVDRVRGGRRVAVLLLVLLEE